MGWLILFAFLSGTMLISAGLAWLLDRLLPESPPAPLAFAAGLVLPIMLCAWSVVGYRSPPSGNDGDIAPLFIFGPIFALLLTIFTVPAAMATIGRLRRPAEPEPPR